MICLWTDRRLGATKWLEEPKSMKVKAVMEKNNIEESIEQCQHPGEGTHIHVVEQVRPQ